MAGGMIGGVSFQVGSCPHCGHPVYPLNGQMGHVCAHPDPRIMAELKAIRELLEKVLDKCQAILE